MNNITINKKDSPDLEYIKQCHLNKILFINVNENNQIFNDYTTFMKRFEQYLNEIKFKKYYLIIVCSQKSISGKGGVHFQHYFKDFIKKNSFTLMSKIDATIPSNKIIKKLSNVRTRIYYNDFYVRLLFDLKKFKYSYGKSFVNSTSNKNIRESTQIYPDILKTENFEPAIVIKNYILSRKTTDNNHGIIAICLDFLLKINNNNNKKNDIFRLIVTNSDLKDNDEIDPNIFINDLKLSNKTEILNFPNNNNNFNSISINIGNNNNLFTSSFQQPNLNNIYNYNTNPRLLVQINDTEVILESLYNLLLNKNNNASKNIVLKYIKYFEILKKYKSNINFEYIIDYDKKIKKTIDKITNNLNEEINEEKKKILNDFKIFPQFAIQTSVEFPPVNMKINNKSSRNSIRKSNSSKINNNENGNQSLGKDIKVYIYL